MKLSIKSIFAVAKSLFAKAVTVCNPANYFSSNLIKTAWKVYHSLKQKHFDGAVSWTKDLRNGLLSDAIKIARRIVEFEKLGFVQFKKVGDDVTVHARNIMVGLLDFEAIGSGLYRFVDEFILSENGGDIKGAIRSFRLDRIVFLTF